MSEEPKMNRQQRRALERKLRDEEEAKLRGVNKPVKRAEFYAYVSILESTIQTLGAFIQEKYGDEYIEFVKKRLDAMSSSSETDNTEEESSEE